MAGNSFGSPTNSSTIFYSQIGIGTVWPEKNRQMSIKIAQKW